MQKGSAARRLLVREEIEGSVDVPARSAAVRKKTLWADRVIHEACVWPS